MKISHSDFGSLLSGKTFSLLFLQKKTERRGAPSECCVCLCALLALNGERAWNDEGLGSRRCVHSINLSPRPLVFVLHSRTLRAGGVFSA